ncbi:serine hydrolase [Streptomyces roseirectus]|uniref:Serine hydrolase n=1 Tax=Streptomyces roseirectus TaxID=2768066 RepID=A0A7H0IFD0_9ACTN|nr:serine hydrolase [Streptomyces roseirectus]QNP71496.1 serine hydrolase [Streptomyces roseirectus]
MRTRAGARAGVWGRAGARTRVRVRAQARVRTRVWCGSVLGACLLLVTSTAAPGAVAAPAVSCTSGQKGLASALRTGIGRAVAGRRGTVAVVLHDRPSRTRCALRGTYAFDSASVVKVAVLGALLWDAQRAGRGLTKRERTLASSMITRSGNTATNTLWNQLGASKVRRFLDAARMTRTSLNPYGYWGLTQLNARDQQRLMDLLLAPNKVLRAAPRAYVLELMGKVVESQRWGTPAGAPESVRVYVKNGWLPRASHGWRVHSTGAFVGGGKSYTITVLSHGNGSMKYGVTTVQRVAKAIHGVLGVTK